MEKKFPFPLVILLSTVGLVATDLYLPSLPFIQAYFQSAKSSVQISLALFLLGFSFSQLLYGPLSDRHGRRPVMILGLSIGCVGSLVCLFAPALFFLNLGRLIQGFGLGVGATLSRTILRDVYSGEELARLGAWVTVSAAMGMALAPILGGAMQRHFGWRSIFIFLTLYACGTLYILWTKLPETNRTLNPHALEIATFFQNYRELFTHPVFIGYSSCASLALAGFSAYFASSPFLFQQVLHLSAEKYGLLATIFAAGLGLGGVVNAKLIPHFGRHRLLTTGTIILFLAGCAMAGTGLAGQISIAGIMIPVSIYSFGAAMVFSNCFAGAFYPFGHMAGFAGALYGCIQILGGAISSALISTIREATQIPLGLFLMALGLLAYGFQRMAIRRR